LGDIKKIAKITLLAVVVVSGFFAYHATKIEFDYDFEAFFSKTDPETDFFNEHRKRFETDNDFVFIALRNESGIFDNDFLTRTRDFVDELKKDSLVEDVQCITHMDEYIKTPFSPAVFNSPYIHVDQPKKYKTDSIRIYSHPEIYNTFLDKNCEALMVNVKHRQYLPKEKCDLLAKYEFKDFKYAGRTVGMGYYVNKMIYETGLFIVLSFGLVIIFLILAFRSVWGLWLPLTIVGVSMLWIIGFMGVVEEPINLILTVLPSIIFVVAMSDVMHLVSKFLEELRNGISKEEAVKIAYKEVGKATLLTSLTTAVGFLSLLFVDMGPVQSFGIFTSIGVMLAFILAYTLLPSMLVLVKAPKVSLKKNTETIWYKVLHPSFLWMVKRRKPLAVGFTILLGVSFYGSSLVIADYYLLEDLKKDNELRKNYQYFDQEFMGLRPFELAVEVKEEGKLITDYEVLLEMNKVEGFLQSEYGLKQTFSLVSVLKLANRTEHSGQIKYFVFPDKEETVNYLKRMEKFDKTGQFDVIVDSTKKYGRIASSHGDIGMLQVQELNKKLFAFIDEEVNTDLVDFKLTGTAHLLDRNMSQLSRSLFWGLGLAIVIVAILMGFLFRSIKMVLIAMVPNVLPLVMLGAILGFAGVELKVSTALVFTISFGIAVDDTIHFMSKLKIELNKGRSLMMALRRTFLSTGRAIVLTTLILTAGFLMLMFSDFLGTFYIGLLISCTLVFALISDLFFLPVLLIFFYKPRKKN
jgi:predicted RND superfamily exporter protein